MSKPDARVVGWVSQVIRDGSIGGRIVPANWTTTDEQLAALNHEPWVAVGKAAVIGLVPESLLSEAESRIVALQSRLDGVRKAHDDSARAANFKRCGCDYCTAIRSAALGGESPANDEGE